MSALREAVCEVAKIAIERDALTARVAELEAALRWTTDICDELLRDGDAGERAHISAARAALAKAAP